ncbi:MAG: hypothetical protein E7269_05030 [Lachnospiraceae bacterium]|nr:hypothetical protein [Lachnospiraceae bacterium]
MKRILAFTMATLMMLSLIGCACATNDNQGNETGTSLVDGNQTNDNNENNTNNQTNEGETTGNNAAGGNSGETADTVAQALLADFKAQVAKNTDIDAQEIADKLLQNNVIKFSGATMEVEEGLLTGFGEAEIRGFDDGVMFSPMIGTIPFIGYVFELEDETDASAFVQMLKDNANPRWNICTVAEETVAENVGDMVFFVMSPQQFEE